MRVARWLSVGGLALVLGLLGGGRVAAEDPPAAGVGETTLDRGLAALKVRLQAKLKEAELLEKAGRVDEALAATRDVDRLYREGLAELERLVRLKPSHPDDEAVSGGPVPRPAPPPPPAPAPAEPSDEPGADGPPTPHATPPAGVFPGRGAKPAPDAADAEAQKRDDAVLHGLRWLAAHQSPDGGWEAEGFARWCDGKRNTGEKPDGSGKPMYDVGVTGLALCAFLGAGYTQRGAHEFARVVRSGLNYLKNVQDPEGCFGPRSTQHFIYNHACAALAMVEAYGMTGSPDVLGSAQKALDFIALARNPYFVWRYGVKPGDNDTSVTGWMATALHSARLINQDAAGRGKPLPLAIDEEAFDGVRAWLDKMTDPATGRVGYITRGSGPARPQEMVDRFPADKSEAMTAVGVLLRVLMGDDPARDPLVQKGAALMSRLPPVWNPRDGSIDMYYWYYGTLAMFQVGGAHWGAWSRALQAAVVGTQRLDGQYCSTKGSWDPIDAWGPDGGRVFSTALMTLCCEVQYRYARVAGAR